MLVFSVYRKPLPESTKRSEKCPASHSCSEMRFHIYIYLMQKGTVLPDMTVFGFVCTAKWNEGLLTFLKWHWTSAISIPRGTDWSCGIHCWSFLLLFHRTCSTGLNSLPFVRLGDFPRFNVKKGLLLKEHTHPVHFEVVEAVCVCVSPARVCPPAAGCLHFHGFPSATVCDYTHPISAISNTHPAGSTGIIKRNHSEALSASGGLRGSAVLGYLYGAGAHNWC